MKPLRPPVLRFFSWLLIGVLCAQDLVWAQGSAAPAPPVSAPIAVPEELGRLRHFQRGSGDSLVVNIQDAHASLPAQKSIAAILESLSKNYDLKMVGLEGSSGEVDTRAVSAYPEKEARRAVAESLLADTKISGAEFFRIVSAEPAELVGVEDEALYARNIEAYKDLLKRSEKIRPRLDRLAEAALLLEKAVYSPAHEAFERTFRRYRSGGEPEEFWDAFDQGAREAGFDWNAHPEPAAWKRLKDLERGIDFKQAETERQDLLRMLAGKLGAAERRPWTDRLQAFRSGKTPAARFHRELLERALPLAADPSAYAALKNYVEYAEGFERLDALTLGQAIEAAGWEIEEKLAQADGSRVLSLRLRAFEITRKFFDASLGPSDDRFFREHPGLFDIGTLSSSIRGRLGAEHAGSSPADDAELAEAFERAKEFYQAVRRRNESMVENLTARMREKGVRVAALVSGGFHSDDLSGLLAARRVSHVVVMPAFAPGKDSRPYVAVITERGSYLDRALRERSVLESVALLFGVEVLSGKPVEDVRRRYLHALGTDAAVPVVSPDAVFAPSEAPSVRRHENPATDAVATGSIFARPEEGNAAWLASFANGIRLVEKAGSRLTLATPIGAYDIARAADGRPASIVPSRMPAVKIAALTEASLEQPAFMPRSVTENRQEPPAAIAANIPPSKTKIKRPRAVWQPPAPRPPVQAARLAEKPFSPTIGLVEELMRGLGLEGHRPTVLGAAVRKWMLYAAVFVTFFPFALQAQRLEDFFGPSATVLFTDDVRPLTPQEFSRAADQARNRTAAGQTDRRAAIVRLAHSGDPKAADVLWDVLHYRFVRNKEKPRLEVTVPPAPGVQIPSVRFDPFSAAKNFHDVSVMFMGLIRNNEDVQARTLAALALGHLAESLDRKNASSSAVERLRDAFDHDPDAGVQAAALYALSSLSAVHRDIFGRDVRFRLAEKALGHPDGLVRMYGYLAVGSASAAERDPRVDGIVLRHLPAERDLAALSAAASVVEKYGIEAALPGLLRPIPRDWSSIDPLREYYAALYRRAVRRAALSLTPATVRAEFEQASARARMEGDWDSINGLYTPVLGVLGKPRTASAEAEFDRSLSALLSVEERSAIERRAAARNLGESKDPAAADPLFVSAAGDPDEDVRMEALRALDEIDLSSMNWQKPLTLFLGDTDNWQRRRAAAEIAAHWGSDFAKPLLASAARDTHPSVRSAALAGLQSSGMANASSFEAALDTVAGGMRGETASAASAAAQALDDAIGIVQAYFRLDKAEALDRLAVRFQSASAAQARWMEALAAHLERRGVLSEGVRGVLEARASASFNALRKLPPLPSMPASNVPRTAVRAASDAPVLLRDFSGSVLNGNDAAENRLPAVEMMVRQYGAFSSGILLRLLDDPQPDMRIEAARALGQVWPAGVYDSSGDGALNALAAFLADGSTAPLTLRLASIQALAAMRTGQAAQRIAGDETLRDGGDPLVPVVKLEALGSMGAQAFAAAPFVLSALDFAWKGNADLEAERISLKIRKAAADAFRAMAADLDDARANDLRTLLEAHIRAELSRGKTPASAIQRLIELRQRPEKKAPSIFAAKTSAARLAAVRSFIDRHRRNFGMGFLIFSPILLLFFAVAGSVRFDTSIPSPPAVSAALVRTVEAPPAPPVVSELFAHMESAKAAEEARAHEIVEVETSYSSAETAQTAAYLKMGDSGPAVRELQRALAARGEKYLHALSQRMGKRDPIDGRYGWRTEQAKAMAVAEDPELLAFDTEKGTVSRPLFDKLTTVEVVFEIPPDISARPGIDAGFLFAKPLQIQDSFSEKTRPKAEGPLASIERPYEAYLELKRSEHSELARTVRSETDEELRRSLLSGVEEERLFAAVELSDPSRSDSVENAAMLVDRLRAGESQDVQKAAAYSLSKMRPQILFIGDGTAVFDRLNAALESAGDRDLKGYLIAVLRGAGDYRASSTVVRTMQKEKDDPLLQAVAMDALPSLSGDVARAANAVVDTLAAPWDRSSAAVSEDQAVRWQTGSRTLHQIASKSASNRLVVVSALNRALDLRPVKQDLELLARLADLKRRIESLKLAIGRPAAFAAPASGGPPPPPRFMTVQYEPRASQAPPVYAAPSLGAADRLLQDLQFSSDPSARIRAAAALPADSVTGPILRRILIEEAKRMIDLDLVEALIRSFPRFSRAQLFPNGPAEASEWESALSTIASDKNNPVSLRAAAIDALRAAGGPGILNALRFLLAGLSEEASEADANPLQRESQERIRAAVSRAAVGVARRNPQAGTKALFEILKTQYRAGGRPDPTLDAEARRLDPAAYDAAFGTFGLTAVSRPPFYEVPRSPFRVSFRAWDDEGIGTFIRNDVAEAFRKVVDAPRLEGIPAAIETALSGSDPGRYERVIGDPDPARRIEAAMVFARRIMRGDTGRPLVDALVFAALHENRDEVLVPLLHALAFLRSPESAAATNVRDPRRPVFESDFIRRHPQDAVRAKLALVFGTSRDEKAVEGLADYLKNDSSHAVRVAASQAARTLKDARLLEALIGILESPSELPSLPGYVFQKAGIADRGPIADAVWAAVDATAAEARGGGSSSMRPVLNTALTTKIVQTAGVEQSAFVDIPVFRAINGGGYGGILTQLYFIMVLKWLVLLSAPPLLVWYAAGKIKRGNRDGGSSAGGLAGTASKMADRRKVLPAGARLASTENGWEARIAPFLGILFNYPFVFYEAASSSVVKEQLPLLSGVIDEAADAYMNASAEEKGKLKGMLQYLLKLYEYFLVYHLLTQDDDMAEIAVTHDKDFRWPADLFHGFPGFVRINRDNLAGRLETLWRLGNELIPSPKFYPSDPSLARQETERFLQSIRVRQNSSFKSLWSSGRSARSIFPFVIGALSGLNTIAQNFQILIREPLSARAFYSIYLVFALFTVGGLLLTRMAYNWPFKEGLDRQKNYYRNEIEPILAIRKFVDNDGIQAVPFDHERLRWWKRVEEESTRAVEHPRLAVALFLAGSSTNVPYVEERLVQAAPLLKGVFSLVISEADADGSGSKYGKNTYLASIVAGRLRQEGGHGSYKTVRQFFFDLFADETIVANNRERLRTLLKNRNADWKALVPDDLDFSAYPLLLEADRLGLRIDQVPTANFYTFGSLSFESVVRRVLGAVNHDGRSNIIANGEEHRTGRRHLTLVAENPEENASAASAARLASFPKPPLRTLDPSRILLRPAEPPPLSGKLTERKLYVLYPVPADEVRHPDAVKLAALRATVERLAEAVVRRPFQFVAVLPESAEPQLLRWNRLDPKTQAEVGGLASVAQRLTGAGTSDAVAFDYLLERGAGSVIRESEIVRALVDYREATAERYERKTADALRGLPFDEQFRFLSNRLGRLQPMSTAVLRELQEQSLPAAEMLLAPRAAVRPASDTVKNVAVRFSLVRGNGDAETAARREWLSAQARLIGEQGSADRPLEWMWAVRESELGDFTELRSRSIISADDPFVVVADGPLTSDGVFDAAVRQSVIGRGELRADFGVAGLEDEAIRSAAGSESPVVLVDLSSGNAGFVLLRAYETIVTGKDPSFLPPQLSLRDGYVLYRPTPFDFEQVLRAVRGARIALESAA